MKCPDCGEILQPEDRFCDNCGALRPTSEPVVVAECKPDACPACGTVNPPNARYCDRCGCNLKPDEPEPPDVLPDGSRICRGCGSRDNVLSDKFCGDCGTQLPVVQEAAVPQLLSAPEKMRLIVMAWDSCQDIVANDRLSDPFRIKMALLLESIPNEGVSAVHSFLRELHQNDNELLPRVARLGAQYVAEHYDHPERDFAAAYLQRINGGDAGPLDVQVAFACVAIVRHLGHLLAEENREQDAGNPIIQLLKSIRDAWVTA